MRDDESTGKPFIKSDSCEFFAYFWEGESHAILRENHTKNLNVNKTDTCGEKTKRNGVKHGETKIVRQRHVKPKTNIIIIVIDLIVTLDTTTNDLRKRQEEREWVFVCVFVCLWFRWPKRVLKRAGRALGANLLRGYLFMLPAFFTFLIVCVFTSVYAYVWVFLCECVRLPESLVMLYVCVGVYGATRNGSKHSVVATRLLLFVY